MNQFPQNSSRMKPKLLKYFYKISTNSKIHQKINSPFPSCQPQVYKVRTLLQCMAWWSHIIFTENKVCKPLLGESNVFRYIQPVRQSMNVFTFTQSMGPRLDSSLECLMYTLLYIAFQVNSDFRNPH